MGNEVRGGGVSRSSTPGLWSPMPAGSRFLTGLSTNFGLGGPSSAVRCRRPRPTSAIGGSDRAQRMGSLSFGRRKRVCLLAAHIGEGRLLDEPSNGIDPPAWSSSGTLIVEQSARAADPSFRPTTSHLQRHHRPVSTASAATRRSLIARAVRSRVRPGKLTPRRRFRPSFPARWQWDSLTNAQDSQAVDPPPAPSSRESDRDLLRDHLAGPAADRSAVLRRLFASDSVAALGVCWSASWLSRADIGLLYWRYSWPNGHGVVRRHAQRSYRVRRASLLYWR